MDRYDFYYMNDFNDRYEAMADHKPDGEWVSWEDHLNLVKEWIRLYGDVNDAYHSIFGEHVSMMVGRHKGIDESDFPVTDSMLEAGLKELGASHFSDSGGIEFDVSDIKAIFQAMMKARGTA